MSVRNEAKVNFLGLGTVVYLGMKDRISLYESAIKELHDVKMKHVSKSYAMAVTETVLIVGMAFTFVTMALLVSPFA